MFFRALVEKKHILNASDVADNFMAVNSNTKCEFCVNFYTKFIFFLILIDGKKQECYTYFENICRYLYYKRGEKDVIKKHFNK